MKVLQTLSAVLVSLGIRQDSKEFGEFEKFCKRLAHDIRTPVATVSMETQSVKFFMDKLRASIRSLDPNTASNTLDEMDSIIENIIQASQVLEKFADNLSDIKQLAK